MEVTILTEENLLFFQNFIYKSDYKQLENKNPQMSALGLIDEDETACGALIYSVVFGELEINSIFVAEDYRNNGGGSLLISSVLKMANEVGIKNAHVIYSLSEKENAAISSFLEKNNFFIYEQNSRVTKFKVSQIKSFPILKTAYKISSFSKNIVPFLKLTTTHLNQLEKSLGPDNLLPENFSLDSICNNISMAYIIDGHIEACVIMSEDNAGLCLEFAYTSPKASNAFLPLIIAVAATVSRNYSPDTTVKINSVNKMSTDLVEKLVGNSNSSSSKTLEAFITVI